MSRPPSTLVGQSDWKTGSRKRSVCQGPIADIAVPRDRNAVSKLAIRYDFDAGGDDFGWLGLTVTAAHFSGRGGFWVQWQDVKEFGETLSTYPITPEKPLKAKWGYEMLEGDDLIVSVEISPANGRGDLRVQVELADQHDPTERLRTSFITNYPELNDFRLAIAQLMSRNADEAILLGS